MVVIFIMRERSKFNLIAGKSKMKITKTSLLVLVFTTFLTNTASAQSYNFGLSKSKGLSKTKLSVGNSKSTNKAPSKQIAIDLNSSLLAKVSNEPVVLNPQNPCSAQFDYNGADEQVVSGCLNTYSSNTRIQHARMYVYARIGGHRIRKTTGFPIEKTHCAVEMHTANNDVIVGYSDLKPVCEELMILEKFNILASFNFTRLVELDTNNANQRVFRGHITALSLN